MESFENISSLIFLEIHDIICRIPYNTHGLFNGQSLDMDRFVLKFMWIHPGLDTFYNRINI